MKLKTCPSCGSTNIRITGDKLTAIAGWKYKCDNCGYSGDIIIEQDVEKLG